MLTDNSQTKNSPTITSSSANTKVRIVFLAFAALPAARASSIDRAITAIAFTASLKAVEVCGFAMALLRVILYRIFNMHGAGGGMEVMRRFLE